MTSPNLSSTDFHALTLEIHDARGSFSHGLAILRRIRSNTDDIAAVFSLLAIGAERLLKLTIGLAELVDNRPWPALTKMQAFRHNIVDMDAEARTLLLARTHLSTVPGHLTQAIDMIDNDTTLAIGLDALSRYGSMGRFYYLDHLANAPQPTPPPRELWDVAEQGIVLSDAEIQRALATPAFAHDAKAAVGTRLSHSLQRWWQTYQRAWTTNPFGLIGAGWAGELDLFDPQHPRRQTLTKLDGEPLPDLAKVGWDAE